MHLKASLTPAERKEAQECILHMAKVTTFSIVEHGDGLLEGSPAGSCVAEDPIDRQCLAIPEDLPFIGYGSSISLERSIYTAAVDLHNRKIQGQQGNQQSSSSGSFSQELQLAFFRLAKLMLHRIGHAL
jgi:hypothetical protein